MFIAVSDLLNMPRKPIIDEAVPDVNKMDMTSETNTNFEPYPVLSAGFSTPGLVLNAYSVAINRLDPAPSKILGNSVFLH